MLEYSKFGLGPYAEFLENVHKDLILVTFALFDRLLVRLIRRLRIFIHVAHGSRYCRRWCSTLRKDVPLGFDSFFDFLLSGRLNYLGVRHRVLTDVLGRHQLRMSIVNYFIDDLIDKNEVFPNALLIENATVIPKYLHHSVDNVHHVRRRHIVPSRSHEINPELFSEEIAESFNILKENATKKGLNKNGRDTYE